MFQVNLYYINSYKMKAYSLGLVSLLALMQGLIVPTVHAKYINTACEANSDCGLDNHLQCIDNSCQCDSNSQIYDGSTHKCLLLAGQQCQLENHNYAYSRQHSQPIKCVPLADCTKSVCRCKPGYRFSSDFLCKPDFGSPCYSENDCDDTRGLSCTERRICDCSNSTLTYQGQFGCINPNDPTYIEMLNLLNQTDYLLKANNLELKDMFNDLGLQNNLISGEVENSLASERQFHDTYNTHDLQFAAQNQAPQQQGGGGGGINIQQLLTLFQTFQSLFPRNQNGNNGNGGGGGGGPGAFFRNLFGGGNNNNNQGGYPESSSPAPAPGYGPPGQPEGMMGQRMGLLNSFLNLFNQMIPIVRQLRMRFMPFRFFRNILNRFAPQSTTAAPPPPAQQIINPPPTVIQSSGNYQTNPIFNGNQAAPPSQTQGTFQFFMRTRDRFRNFLRGNQQGSQGGYDSGPPGNSYGPPGEAPPPPPPSDNGAEPVSNSGNDDPPPPAPAGSSQQSSYLNSHRPPPQSSPNRSIQHGQQSQSQYSTIHVGGHQAIPPPHPTQRHQNFGGNNNGASLPSPSTYNSGHRPNHESFFDGPQQQSQNQNSFKNNHNSNNNNYNNNDHNNNQNQFSAQATSHRYQSTTTSQYQPQQQQSQNYLTSSQPSHRYNQNSNKENYGSSSDSRPQFPHVSDSPSPPPIPQLKHKPNLQNFPQSSKTPASTQESLSQNFILSEADDPHPGFTPHSTSLSSTPPQQESYRTSARFERIGTGGDSNEGEPHPRHHKTNIDQKWRETF